MAGERTKSAPFLLASPFAVLLLWTMELLVGGTSYDARVSLLSLGLASLLSLFLASLSLRGAGWRRVSSFLPLLIFVLEAAAFLALLLEVALSYGARIDGGFFLVGKGIRLVGTGQAVPYPGGEEWMYGKDLYSYPFRFDVPIAFLILLVLLVLYRKEAKGWLLRFLRMDGEGLLALVLILPFALVSLSRPRGLPSLHGGISPGPLPGVPLGGPPLLPCPLEGTGDAIPHRPRPRPRLPRGTYEAGALDPFRGSGIATSARRTYPSPSSPIPGSLSPRRT